MFGSCGVCQMNSPPNALKSILLVKLYNVCGVHIDLMLKDFRSTLLFKGIAQWSGPPDNTLWIQRDFGNFLFKKLVTLHRLDFNPVQ